MKALRHYLRFIAIVLSTLAVPAIAQLREAGTGAPGPVKAPHITAELISDSRTISPGSASHVALSLTMEAGWHVYWQYAGDSGEAPTVSWSAPQGITLGPMQFPAPSRLPLGPLMDYGYEGTAIFPYALTASRQLPVGGTTLQAHVQWLVCREVCLPGKAFLGLALKVAPTASSGTNPLIDAAIHAEPSPLPDSVKVRASANRTLLTLDITTGKKENAAEYYPLDDASIRNAAEQKIEPTSHGVKLVTERADISDVLPKEVKGVLKLGGGRSYDFDVAVMARAAQEHSDAGDKFVFAQDGWKERKAAELRAVERIFSFAPEATAKVLLDLWKEFDAGETAEAKFAKDLREATVGYCERTGFLRSDAGMKRSWV